MPSRRRAVQVVCHAQRGAGRDMRKSRTPEGTTLVAGHVYACRSVPGGSWPARVGPDALTSSSQRWRPVGSGARRFHGAARRVTTSCMSSVLDAHPDRSTRIRRGFCGTCRRHKDRDAFRDARDPLDARPCELPRTHGITSHTLGDQMKAARALTRQSASSSADRTSARLPKGRR